MLESPGRTLRPAYTAPQGGDRPAPAPQRRSMV